MKTTKIIFLRHAETQKDHTVNATLWGLSEKGKDQSQKILKILEINTIDVIYASEEQKTFLTAEPIAKKLKKKIHLLSSLNEVKRGDKFLTKEEFEIEKVHQLNDLSYRAFGGESGLEALDRFERGISCIVEKNKGKTTLVVTHGTVLNIYFAKILNTYKELPERWSKTKFCAYGIVENGEVTKDII